MPPSEAPRSSRSRPRRVQPPSSTARQNAAFGSRPARPLPRPVVRAAPAPRVISPPRAPARGLGQTGNRDINARPVRPAPVARAPGPAVQDRAAAVARNHPKYARQATDIRRARRQIAEALTPPVPPATAMRVDRGAGAARAVRQAADQRETQRAQRELDIHPPKPAVAMRTDRGPGVMRAVGEMQRIRQDAEIAGRVRRVQQQGEQPTLKRRTADIGRLRDLNALPGSGPAERAIARNQAQAAREAAHQRAIDNDKHKGHSVLERVGGVIGGAAGRGVEQTLFGPTGLASGVKPAGAMIDAVTRGVALAAAPKSKRKKGSGLAFADPISAVADFARSRQAREAGHILGQGAKIAVKAAGDVATGGLTAPGGPATAVLARSLKADQPGRKALKKTARKTAPSVQTGLDQLTRLQHAGAAATASQIDNKGHINVNPAKYARAAKRGALLKDRTNYKTVYRKLGVKGPAADIAGYGTDVLADPTTYLTGGTGALARRAGEVALKEGARAAARQEGKALVGRAAKEAAARARPTLKPEELTAIRVKAAKRAGPIARRKAVRVAEENEVTRRATRAAAERAAKSGKPVRGAEPTEVERQTARRAIAAERATRHRQAGERAAAEVERAVKTRREGKGLLTHEQTREAGRKEVEAAKQAGREPTPAEQAKATGTTTGFSPQAIKAAKGTTTKAGREKSGLILRWAGHEIPGVRRATAVAHRPGALGRVIPAPVRGAVRGLAAEVNPNIRPTAGTSATAHQARRVAQRQSTATVSQFGERANVVAQQARKVIGPDEHATVIDAIERDDLSRLVHGGGRAVPRTPEALKHAREVADSAHEMRSLLKWAYRRRRRVAAQAGEGRIADQTAWMSDRARNLLNGTVDSELAAAVKGVGRAETKLERQQARQVLATAVGHEQAKGRANVNVAQAEGAYGTRRAEALGAENVTRATERGAAQTRQATARGAARVSELTPKTTPDLRALRSEERAAGREAKKSAKRLVTQQAKPVTRRRGVAALDAEVARNARRLTAAREAVAREEARIKGVAPKPADELRRAIAGTETAGRAAPVREAVAATDELKAARRQAQVAADDLARIEAQAPEKRAGYAAAGARADRAQARVAELEGRGTPETPVPRVTAAGDRYGQAIGERGDLRAGRREPTGRERKAADRVKSAEDKLHHARESVEAAHGVPRQGMLESDSEYLARVGAHAEQHGQRWLAGRVEGLQEEGARLKSERARGYFPREQAPTQLTPEEARTAGLVGKVGYPKRAITGFKTPLVRQGYARQAPERLEVLRDRAAATGTTPPGHDENVGRAFLTNMKRSSLSIAKGDFNRYLVHAGRDRTRDYTRLAAQAAREGAKPEVSQLVRPGESLWHVGYDKNGRMALERVTELPDVKPYEQRLAEHEQAVAKAVEKGEDPTKVPGPALGEGKARQLSGQYVALDDDMMRTAMEWADDAISGAQTSWGKTFDRANARWKQAALFSLAFHVHNVVGDLEAHYRATSSARHMPNDLIQAARVTGRYARLQKQLVPQRRILSKLNGVGENPTIRMGGKQMGIDDALREMNTQGVTDSGRWAREVRDILTGGDDAHLAGRGRLDRLGHQRWVTARENLFRAATYKNARDQGMTAEQAAQHVAHYHVDYGELSPNERQVLRRFLPFYTWNSRAFVRLTKDYFTKPGKIANVEKVRQDLSDALSGTTEDQRRREQSPYILRQLPVTVRFGDHLLAVNPSLPEQLVGYNLLAPGVPRRPQFGEFLSNWASQLNPFIKAPIELRTGVRLGTQTPIKPEGRPYTPAPKGYEKVPGLKQFLKITTFVDPKTGKKIAGMDPNRAYLLQLMTPGAAGQLLEAAAGGKPEPTGGAGSGLAGSALRFGGLTPTDVTVAKGKLPEGQRVLLSARRQEIKSRMVELNNQGIRKANATPEYDRASEEYNQITKVLDANKPAALQTKRKGRKKAASGFGGGGFGSGFGGSSNFGGGGFGSGFGGSSNFGGG